MKAVKANDEINQIINGNAAFNSQRHYNDVCSISLIDTFRLNETSVPQISHYVYFSHDGIETDK